MRTTLLLLLAVGSVIINQVQPIPLTVVPGKSGEQQVKEALDKAERESEEAAKATTNKGKSEKNNFHSQESKEVYDEDSEKKDKSTSKEDSKVITDIKGSSDSVSDSVKKESKQDTDEGLKSKVHDEKQSPAVTEKEKQTVDNTSSISTDHNRSTDHEATTGTNSSIEHSTSAKTDTKQSDETNTNLSKEESNSKASTNTHDDTIKADSNHSDSKLKDTKSSKASESITGLNSGLTSALSKVGVKKEGKDLELERENEKLEEESNRKMTEMAKKLNSLVMRFQHKLAADRLRNRAHGALNGDIDDNRRRGKTANSNPLDLSSLELALLTKNRTKLRRPNGQIANQYKEDTKLEDRLAMEAEEERKFNNGETYESDDELTGENTKASQNSQFTGSSLSPKEQASQEMQSYNALISSESNRELSQIQEEIAKTSQAGMGQVSVEGENQNVPVDGSSPSPVGGAAGGSLANQLGSSIAAQLGAQLNGGNLANQLSGSVENSLSNLASASQSSIEPQGQSTLDQGSQSMEGLETGATTGSEVSQAISSMQEMGGQETSQYQPGETTMQQQSQIDPNTLSQVGGATGAIEAGGIAESLQGIGAGGGSMETISSPNTAGAVGGGAIETLSTQQGGGLPAGIGGLMEGANFGNSMQSSYENLQTGEDMYNKKSKITNKGKKALGHSEPKRGRKRRKLGKAPGPFKKSSVGLKRKSLVKPKGPHHKKKDYKDNYGKIQSKHLVAEKKLYRSEGRKRSKQNKFVQKVKSKAKA